MLELPKVRTPDAGASLTVKFPGQHGNFLFHAEITHVHTITACCPKKRSDIKPL